MQYLINERGFFIKKRIFMMLTMLFICATITVSAGISGEEFYDYSKLMVTDKNQLYITRAEFSHYLTGLLQEKGIKTEKSMQSFPDMSVENENYEDVVFLKDLSIINGDGNGNFRPYDYISYHEVAAMASRIFATDKEIMTNYGEYPYGYVKFALKQGMFNDITAVVDDSVTLKDFKIIMSNIDESLKVYDVMERLGCDVYNGEVYIDYYPKDWQGFEQKPAANLNGYFKILPAKLLYSYDNKNWNLAYEDIDGERIYYDLPNDIDIEGVRYAWEYSAFVNYPFNPDKKYYSYDYEAWYEGVPDKTKDFSMPVYKEDFIMGIEKDYIITDSESGLYFSWKPYERNSYFSERYETVLQEYKYNMIWVSKDLTNWVAFKIPDSMLFFTRAGINREAKALMLYGAENFTAEEQTYIDNEEKIANKLGLGYDKPSYKTEKYMLKFSEIHKILDETNS